MRVSSHKKKENNETVQMFNATFNETRANLAKQLWPKLSSHVYTTGKEMAAGPGKI